MNKWIKCSDRMPEDMMDVLFTFVRDNIKCEYAIGHHEPSGWNSCFLFNSMKLSNDKSIVNVTHWMPLPEPPDETC